METSAASTIPGSPRTGQRPHIPALDGVRGIAVLLVLMHHAIGLTWIAPQTALHRALLSAGNVMNVGVDLFFVLSGTLITGILLETRESPHYFRNFYARRALRIFPVYYAFLAFFLLLLPVLLPAGSALVSGLRQHSSAWFWLYMTNVLVFVNGAWTTILLNHAWSLAIEEQFYLVWPLLVWLLPRRHMKAVLWTLVLVSVGVRVALALLGHTPPAIRVFTLGRLDGFAVGGLIALCLGTRPERLLGRLLPLFGASALILLLLRATLAKGRIASAACDFTLTAAASGVLVSLAAAPARVPLVTAFLQAPPLRILGKYSYAVYLFHVPVFVLAGRPLESWLVSHHVSPVLIWALKLPLLGSVSLGLAWLSWNLLEKHALALKRYFPD